MGLNNSERTDFIRSELKNRKLDAIIVQLPENVLFLSGFWPMIGMTFLVFPAEGNPVCIIPDCYEKEAENQFWEAEKRFYSYGIVSSPDPLSEVKRHIKSLIVKHNWRRIGTEISVSTMAVSWNSAEVIQHSYFIKELLKESFEDVTVIDINHYLSDWKLIKTKYEIEKIRIANEAACFGLNVFEQVVQPGISAVEIVAEVEKAIMTKATLAGMGRVRSWAQIAVGPNETAVAYRPNEISTSRRLVEGDLSVLELGVVVNGYWSDRTRTRVAGKCSSKQKEVFEIVQEAQEAAVKGVKACVSAAEVDSTARSVIRAAGYECAFPHITGHGVGFAYHDSGPVISPDNTELLQTGMIHSIEPGIYLPEMGGIRLEDDILVTDDAAVVLGPYRKKLFE